MPEATVVPREVPPANGHGPAEDEPLLGRPGAVCQKEQDNLLTNLTSGTAAIAQIGITILVALVWAAIFSNKLIYFSPHPLLNSLGVLFNTQAILILQPTHTPQQKRTGALTHQFFIAVANALLVSGLVIIELNKASHPGTRFKSPHAILGLCVYIFMVIQAAVGATMFYFPAEVYGSVVKGKRVYKWHRWSGYSLFLLQLGTISAATQTDYNRNVLHIRLWTVLAAIVLVVAGVGARIRKQKMKLWG